MAIPLSRGIIPAAKNTYRMLVTGDTWSSLIWMQAGGVRLSGQWLDLDKGRSKLIVHALGNYKYPNTLKGARESVARGARLLEVDLYKDSQGILRCHHGPEKPSTYKAGDCTLVKLLKALPNNTFVILDIKTEFFESAESIVNTLQDKELTYLSKKLIFQLYKPSDVEWFYAMASKNPELIRNKPIITLYKTHATAPLVSRVVPSSIGAITYPMDRSNMLLKSIEYHILGLNHKTYVHPIRSCPQYNLALASSAYGVYGPSKLHTCVFHN
jgi:hypothetical protein